MFTQEVTVNNEVGLHARPATYFIQKANEFKSGIWVEKEERRVNAKSLLGVLSLGIVKGTTITLIADGPDAKEAVEALGVEIISRPVATVENGLVRHNPGHLAWELVQLHNQRNIRLVCRDSHRTTCNRVET
jgi:phosphocarrier protein HPr